MSKHSTNEEPFQKWSSKNIEDLMESFEVERQQALQYDDLSATPLHDLMHTFCAGLSSTMESIPNVYANPRKGIAKSAERSRRDSNQHRANAESAKARNIGTVGRGSKLKSRKEKRMLRCPKCGYGCGSIGTMIAHLRDTHQMMPRKAGISFRCDCGHQSSCANHRCEISNFTVIEKSEEEYLSGTRIINRTIEKQASQKLLRCPFCQIGYQFFSSLVAHLARTHNTNPREAEIAFRCDCGVEVQGSIHKCKNRNFTIVHKSLEQSDREVAEKAAAKAAALAAPAVVTPFVRKRITKQWTEGEFGCDDCGKAFTRQQNLKKHIRSRCGTGCAECSMTFKSTIALLQHRMIHHGKKNAPFPQLGEHKCEECGALFKDKAGLLNHLPFHGSARFKCEHCGNEHSHEAYLKVHLRKSHGLKAQECRICKKKFGMFKEMKAHRDDCLKMHLSSSA